MNLRTVLDPNPEPRVTHLAPLPLQYQLLPLSVHYFYRKSLPRASPFDPGFILLASEFSLIMTFNLSEPSSKLLNTKSLFSLCPPVRSHVQHWFRCSPGYKPWSVITSPPKCVPSSLDWIVSSWSQEHSMATQLHSSARIVFWTGILSPFSSAHPCSPPGLSPP